MRVSRTLAQAVAVLLVASQLTPVWAQSAAPAPAAASPGAPPDEAAIKGKFAAALRLHKAGKFDEALPLFRELVQATQSPNARLYVGLCLQQLGKNSEAYKEMAQTVKDASRDPKYDQTREAAQSELAVLNVKVGKLVVTLPETPSGLVVTLDGAPIAERDLGASLVLDPGGHRVEATATGHAPVTREVTVEGGETRTVTIAFSKPEPVAVAPKPEPPPPEPPASRGAMRLAAFTAVGVGAAGMIMFAVTGVMARGKYNTLKDACGDRPCTDPKYAGDVSSGKSLQTVANVGLVVGAVGLVAGGTLLYFGTRKDSPRATALPLPGGGYVSYAASF
jgi:hypothetical protein